jgi:hypothetical protein
VTDAPKNIFIIGGGRWAKAILSSVGAMSLPDSRIVVRTVNNQAGMAAWLEECELDHRVSVITDWPVALPGDSSACAIVANAANDHEEAIRWALTHGIPVLAEKPITLSGNSLRIMVAEAYAAKVTLFPAQVFLFAPWMAYFAAEVAARGGAYAVEIEFEDPTTEIRHGENKSYDPGVPIFVDWLPHATAILSTLLPTLDGDCERIEFDKGGSSLTLFLRLSGRPCCLRFRRNGQTRKRLVIVTADGPTSMQLDFSIEPPTILINGKPLITDPSWQEKPRPLAAMLTTFFSSAANGISDARFGLDAALCAGRLIDQVRPLYRAVLLPWLCTELESGQVGDELMYALNELAHSRALVLNN